MKLIFSKAYLIKIRNKSSGESWRLATIEDPRYSENTKLTTV